MCGKTNGNAAIVAALMAVIAALESSDSPGLTSQEDFDAIDASGAELHKFYGDWFTPIENSRVWQAEHGTGRASFIGYVRSEIATIKAAEQ